MPKNKSKKVHVIFNKSELKNILNRFSVEMLYDNLDDEDKNLARKIHHALEQCESGGK